ncbi:MAG: helix-turn-helix transcriptional regulator [Hyphomicrobiaceae bacterium]|nr:helix-turn-helix transcriptional regulator [Hyphomicrobiaceae bacterium]
MDHASAISALAALAHTHRLAVFRRLVTAGPSGMAAGDIARNVGIGATALSFHVKELDRAGLVRSWRDGRFVRYSADIEGMRRLIAFLTEDCCQGRPDLCGGIAAGVAETACCAPAPEAGPQAAQPRRTTSRQRRIKA